MRFNDSDHHHQKQKHGDGGGDGDGERGLHASLLVVPPGPCESEHEEKHFTAGDVIRDIIIGMSDGLTVPFALAAGLSGANASSSIIVTAGLAEVAAGSIAMGLGGYVNLSLSLF